MKKKYARELLFAAAVLLLAGGAVLLRPHAPGAAARVTVSGGEEMLLSLEREGRYAIEGGRLPVTLEIAGGRIRFVESQCPDHICERYGWLSQENDQAVCMPAGVVVTVEGGP